MPKAETSGLPPLPLNQVDYCLEFQYLDIEGMGDAEIANKVGNQATAWLAKESNQNTLASSIKFCVYIWGKHNPDAPRGKMTICEQRLKFDNSVSDDPNKPVGVKVVARFWIKEEHTMWKMRAHRIKINSEEFFENE